MAGRGAGDAGLIPAVYALHEPSAYALLEHLSSEAGAVTDVFDYAALHRYLGTRGRIKAHWPRPCADSGAEFREPRPLVRCALPPSAASPPVRGRHAAA